jgi:predicted nucleotide-binding protein (sugar kinase/HSP70/actin superfamily)
MSEALRSRYLEALGVPEFLYDEDKFEDVDAKKINTLCLVIETQNSRSFCQTGKYQDFLLKMLSAIGLQQQDVNCISINADDLSRTLGQYNAKTVLLMSKYLKSSSEQHFIAHHPSEILVNEQLKRETWEVLKKIKACLK